jgi:hypothetical protein
MSDPITDGLQKAVDIQRPGYTVTNFAAIVGMQTVDENGRVKTVVTLYHPIDQPDYTTEGLLYRGDRLLNETEETVE